jgi:uncharacterized protein (DUF4415 family)
MKRKLIVPTEAEDREIAAGIAADPDAPPDFGDGIPPGFRFVGRPKSANPKEVLNIRLDADVVSHFRSSGPGWQTRINAALRKAAGL